ncbi:MAG: RluA family pseudouridine synthase [Candidatus Campbellbacteria bacterium]|nr:RluA family pseudouridine synthase [Candidatus Campbellbacteria bacterium]
MNIKILYEDDDVVFINKPSGVMVHEDGRGKGQTLVDWVIEHYPDSATVGEPQMLSNGMMVDRPGIVHRLDADTSGVLVIAKTEDAFVHLKCVFQEREATKVYRAFVYGSVKKDTDVINRPIGKSRTDPRLWSAQRGARGVMRDAITHYDVLQRGTEHSYLELRPKTGRTHQIRVHLKAINHPVICDRLYAPKQEAALGFERLALHACSLSLMLPSGTIKTVEAPLPPDFVRAEKILKKEGK